MLKKILTVAIAVVVIAVTAVIAEQVYDRTQVTLARATGTVNWTNTVNYAAIKLQNIWLINSYVAIDTVTVQRVTLDTVPMTNTVCTITNAGNKGDAKYSLNERYMKPTDYLVFTSGSTTGCTAIIDYEVQKH